MYWNIQEPSILMRYLKQNYAIISYCYPQNVKDKTVSKLWGIKNLHAGLRVYRTGRSVKLHTKGNQRDKRENKDLTLASPAFLRSEHKPTAVSETGFHSSGNPWISFFFLLSLHCEDSRVFFFFKVTAVMCFPSCVSDAHFCLYSHPGCFSSY